MRYQALLFCPDEKIARLVTQVLSELDFSVEPASEPFAAVKKLMAQHFDAIVVDCENEQNATLLFKSARNSNSNQFSLAVAVVEGQAGVAKAFRIGANLVLTKPINVEQAKGTLRVARGLLRKSSETGKIPAAQSAAFSAQSARPEIPAPDASRTSADASLTQKPGSETPKAESAVAIPPAAASSSAFEVEQDPTPKPDAAEATLLEYMHDPIPSPSLGMSAPNQTSSKSYPWQPASKAPSEPMASALQRAAEAASKSAAPAQETKSAKSASSHSTSAAIRQLRPFMAPMRGAEGAAAAPALAKEKPRALVFDTETEEPAQKPILTDEGKPQFAGKHSSSTAVVPYPAATVPSFSTFGSDDAEKEASGNRQIRLIVIAVILLLVVAGYFRWTTLHRKASPQPNAPTQVQASTPVPQASRPVQDAAAPQIQEQAANTAVEAEPAPTESASVAKSTSVAKTTAPPSTATTKAAASAPSPADNIRVAKAIVVKTDLSKPEAQSQQDAPLPGALNIGTGSNPDKAISNLMATTAVNVPKPVPQVVRVSQGVSQGLLMKKVQPTYPPQALTMRLQGTVQLQATISKNGSITNLTVLSGQASLAHAAVDAVRQWKYKPYFLNGEPVEIQTQIAVNFKLPN